MKIKTKQMSVKKFENVYQFHILLERTKPRVWRRIQVPENYTMWDLHVAIQDAMGWDDCHLHEFRTIEKRPGRIERIGIPDDYGYGNEAIPGWEQDVKDWFVLDKRPAMNYEYDFGDGWHHKITLEKILPIEKGVKYPICIDGKNMCPFEDSGGIWGFYEKIDILKNPEHELYEEIHDWMGDDQIDLTKFDYEDIIFDDPKKRLKDMLNYR
jgi:hypothetical protein